MSIELMEGVCCESPGISCVDTLVKDKDKLAKVLKYHVVAGERISMEERTKGKEMLVTLERSEVTLTKPKKTRHFVNKAHVLERDGVRASNGVVYVIDRVLLPPGV
jgi:uncharacterized surface protein with fasciclin (FAS1) repeats